MEKKNDFVLSTQVVVLVLKDADALQKFMGYVESEQLSVDGESSVEDVKSILSSRLSHYAFIKGSRSGYERYALSDIVYIKAMRSYCEIYIRKDAEVKKHLVSCPMKDVMRKLRHEGFVQISHSYSVSLRHVKCYYGNYVVMENGECLPIGRDYKDELNEKLIVLGSRNRKK